MEYNAVLIKQNGPSTRRVPRMLSRISSLFGSPLSDSYVVYSLQSAYDILTIEEDAKEYEVYVLVYRVERNKANQLLNSIKLIVEEADYKVLPSYAVSRIEFNHGCGELEVAFDRPLLFIACTNKIKYMNEYPEFFAKLKMTDPQLWQEIAISS